jgi:hypothetical protein
LRAPTPGEKYLALSRGSVVWLVVSALVSAGGGDWLAPRARFRYLRAVRSRVSVVLVLAGLGLVAFGAGCQRRAKTPAEAWQRFTTALASRDAGQLYASLDLDTRWSLMSVRRAQREAYDIVLSNFPEGPAREQQLRRFEVGALAENEAVLVTVLAPATRLDELAKDLPEKGDPESTGARDAAVKGKSGKPLPLHQGDDGGWGFAGFAGEAEDWKKRATADLEVVRTNAADLERAATRAGN